MEQYRDTPMDLADASLVATAEILNLRRIFTCHPLAAFPEAFTLRCPWRPSLPLACGACPGHAAPLYALFSGGFDHGVGHPSGLGARYKYGDTGGQRCSKR